MLLKGVQFCFLTYYLYTIHLENTKLKRKKSEWENAKHTVYAPHYYRESPKKRFAHCVLVSNLIRSLIFTRLLRGNHCNPVTDNSEVGSSSGVIRVQEVESQYIETLQEMNDNYVDHINIDNDHVNDEIDADDKKEAVFSHISISQETAKKIQMNTMQQSESATWYKEHQYASYFGKVSKMHKSTSPVRLATTITSQCLVVLGEGIMSQML